MVGVPGSCSALRISNLQGVAETSSMYAAGQQYHQEALPLLEGKILKNNILIDYLHCHYNMTFGAV